MLKLNNLAFIIYSLMFLVTLRACEKENDISNNDVQALYEQYGTPFENSPATEDVVLYEVNLRAFSVSGDLDGITAKLDHIQSLGVNVIWLMPIHPIGEINSVNSPYSVKDYKAVSTEYGTLEDLRKLTDEAHARGMAVLMDWVANHTAWDNEWINNTSWYSQDSDGNIIHPPGTNWQDVADLNYDNLEMREAMVDAMKYWIYEANIDGFRCDYADGVPFDFWQETWNELEAIPNRELLFFAEGDRSDHFNAGFDLSFSWQFYGAIKNVFDGDPVSTIITAHNDEYNGIAEGKQWIRFTTNHDESAWDATPIEIFNGVDGALAASVATIFTGGVPLIYGSQEVGTSSTIPFFYNSIINWNANSVMLANYQKMMQFYISSQTARVGMNTNFSDNNVACLKKVLDNDEILIFVNVRNFNVNFTVPAELENTTWTDVMDETNITLTTQLSLEPYQFYIFD